MSTTISVTTLGSSEAQAALDSAHSQALDADAAGRAKRAELRARAASEAAAGSYAGVTEDVEDTTTQPVEICESIDVELPDGRIVNFGPPAGISLSTRILFSFGDLRLSQMAQLHIKTLMCVRSIDGRPPRAITNMVEVQSLANQLGDQSIELLMAAYVQHWPPTSLNDLRVVKKNIRGS